MSHKILIIMPAFINKIIRNPEDIFYIHTEEMLDLDQQNLEVLVDRRRKAYKEQMTFTKIPRVILSNGDTYYYPKNERLSEHGFI